MSAMDDPGVLTWRKSLHSVANGACVQVASGRAKIAVRDSVDPAGPVLGYSLHGWQTFIAETKAGAFDVR